MIPTLLDEAIAAIAAFENGTITQAGWERARATLAKLREAKVETSMAPALYEALDRVHEFHVGQPVQKRSGYQFPSVVVSAFWTLAGKPRYVVEAEDRNFAGMLHIFSGEQLEPRG